MELRENLSDGERDQGGVRRVLHFENWITNV